MPRTACCVPGCAVVTVDGVPLHYFPNYKNDTKRFQNWVKIIWGGNKSLDTITIQKTQRVCHKHFRKEFHYPKNRLCKMAVPSLLLSSEDLTGFKARIQKNNPDDSSSEIPTALQNTEEVTSRTTTNLEIPTATSGVTPKNIHQSGQKSHRFNEKPQKGSIPLPKVCQICLCTDIEYIGGIDGALVDFHNELVYYDLLQEPCLQYCALCLHLLRKLYNFRQKCRRAHVLLKGWFDKLQNASNQEPLESLQNELPKPVSRVELCTAESRNRVYDTVANENSQNKLYRSWMKRTLLMKKIQLDQCTEDSDKLPDSIEPKRRKLNTLINITNDASLELLVKSARHKSSAGKTTHSNNIRAYLQSVRLGDELMCTPNTDTDEHQECDSNDMFTLNENCNKTLPNTRKQIKNRRQYMKEYHAAERLKFKASVMKGMEQGEFTDLNDQGTILTKELFAKLFDKSSVKKVIAKEPDTIRKFLMKLLRTYNPVYETVFDIEHLSTAEKAADDFRRRKDSILYLEAQIKCHLCYRSFESEKVLRKHMEWHDENRPHSCSVCPMRFGSKNKAKQHAYVNHTHVFRCKFCPFYTNIRSSMKQHFIFHAAKDVQTPAVFVCHTCNTLYGSEELLHRHQLVTHGDHRLECSLCGRGFASHNGLKRHLQENHADASEELSSPPSERCQLCTASFHRSEALVYHALELHTDRFMIKAPGGKVLWQTKQSDNYLKAAEASKRVIIRLSSKTIVFEICYVCDEVVHKFKMYEHFTSLHPAVAYRAPGKNHVLCELCGKYFSSACIYKEHMNKHTGERPYECSECGARFARQLEASRHVERHGGVEYPCLYCNKIFHTKGGHTIHTKIHTKQQKYSCQSCNKKFSHPSKLRYHINGVHRNIKRVKKTNAHQNVLRRRLTPAFVKKLQDADNPVVETVESGDLTSHGDELQTQVYDETQFQNLVYHNGDVQDYVEYEVQTQSDDESMKE